MDRKELLAQGQQMMRICNSCRYCEGLCAVWRSMEYRREFPEGDLNYLANLCHDCTECFYACQYAPPHEWDINPPLTFGRLRTYSYEKYGWPGGLASAFRANGLVVSLVMALALIGAVFAIVQSRGQELLWQAVPGGASCSTGRLRSCGAQTRRRGSSLACGAGSLRRGPDRSQTRS